MAIYRGPGGSGDATTDAASQATVATTKAAEAATSASAASSSASAAATSASNASTSAGNAETSKNEAETAKIAAELAETNAETAQTAAETAQSAAELAETNAETAQTAAETAQTAAELAETNAETAQTAAETAQTAAELAETNAETAETNAANSATAAATSANDAATSYDSFDDRYLGAKATPPTLDNDGDALLTGALYWNTGSNQLFVWAGSAWEEAAFSISGSVTSFNTRTGAVTLSSTDVTNVGALMDSELTSEASVKALDQGVATTDSPSFAGLTVASDSAYAIDVSRPSAGNTTLRITGGTTAGNDVVFRADIGNTTGTSAIYFGDSDTNGIGRIMYEHNGDYMRFYTSSTEKMRIDSSGNVGIGTTSPSGMLHLSGALPRIYLTDTDTATVSTFSGENGWLTLSAATSRMTFNIAGSEKMRIVGDNVGIGTSSPAEPLHVIGTIRSNTSSTGAFNFYATSTGGGAYRIYPDDATTANPTWLYQSNSSEDQAWVIGGVERMRLNSTGNVGIGTTSPASLLHLSSGSPRITLTDTGTGADHRINADSSVGNLAFDVDYNSDTASPVVVFNIKGTEKMRITSTGNVGIGTSSPSVPLTVAGKGIFSGGGSFEALELITSDNNRVYVTGNSSVTGDMWRIGTSVSNSSLNIDALQATGSILLRTGGANERMRIDSAGNVGIGTTTTTYRLNVGDGRAMFTGQNNKFAVGLKYGVGVNGCWIGSPEADGFSVSSAGGGERMRIDGSGRVTMPNQVSFRVEKTVDQTATFPGTMDVTWDSAAYDVGSNFNFTNSRFYAPVTGKYAFSVGLRVDLIDSAANYYILKIATSNATYTWILSPKFSTDLAYMSFTLSTIADMDAGDYCLIQIQQSAGHATTHVHGSTGYDWFCGHLLG